MIKLRYMMPGNEEIFEREFTTEIDLRHFDIAYRPIVVSIVRSSYED